jgi:anti-sigma regulatory factor (Ser/Thr protein kinase)
VGDRPDEWIVALDIELDGEAAARQARWLVHDALVADVSAPFLNDVLLATSELVTNAVVYAPGPCRLTLRCHKDSTRFRIGVADTSAVVPRLADERVQPDPAAGRGLRVVEMLSSAWGMTRFDPGAFDPGATKWRKELWFEMIPGYHT